MSNRSIDHPSIHHTVNLHGLILHCGVLRRAYPDFAGCPCSVQRSHNCPLIPGNALRNESPSVDRQSAQDRQDEQHTWQQQPGLG